MSAITQTTGNRSVLASLQSTAAQLGVTQNRLATGERVNSALDNPISYFTSQSLSHQANGLSALLDNIGLAQGAMKEALQGLTSLVGLTESAKTIAEQARRTPPPLTNYAQIDEIGAADASAEVAGSVTGSVDTSAGGFAAVVNGLQIQVGANTYTVHQPAAEGINAIIADINNTVGLGPYGAVTAGLDPLGRFITLTANDSNTSFAVQGSPAAAALGIAGQSGTSTDLLQAVAGLSGTSLTVQGNGGLTKTITFGNGGAQVSTFAGLQNALLGTGAVASLVQNGSAKNIAISAAATVGTQNTLTTSGSALGALGIAGGGVQLGIATTPVSNRVALQAQYNALLHQIDTLARDSSFNGINLLQGDNLNVKFNESGGSAFRVSGVTYDAAGLGLSTLSGTQFQSNTGIDVVTTALNAALTMMRTAASTFGSGLSTLTIRQDFMKGSVNILQTGGDALVLADTNQEGANLLALQTRQSLSSTALALTAQSDQAVLKLFQ
jgi:flagellin